MKDNVPIFSFDNLEISWDEKGRKKFITIDIRTSIKQIYTKYSSNIERFIVARKNRLKDFKLLDEHTGILSWSSSKSSYCKDEAEKLEKDIKCWATYKYYYNNKDAKENGEIELNKNHSGIPIEYEIRVDNDTNYESFHNPEGTYIVSFENWWDAATEKKIKVSVRCLNCIDKQFKTKEIVIRNYFPKKVLKDGGGYDGTDSWKDEYGYENDFYRNGLIQEEKNKYNKQEDLRNTQNKLRDLIVKHEDAEIKQRKVVQELRAAATSREQRLVAKFQREKKQMEQYIQFVKERYEETAEKSEDGHDVELLRTRQEFERERVETELKRQTTQGEIVLLKKR